MTLVEAPTNAIADRSAQSSSPLSVKNVLFATDFSATSESALPYATAICRRFRSTLHLLHVVSEASLLMMTGGGASAIPERTSGRRLQSRRQWP